MDTLQILIGDDCFAGAGSDPRDALSNIFLGMADAAKHKAAFPIRIQRERDLYVARNIVPYIGEVRVRPIPSVDELILEARHTKYDLVVTDLDYGRFGGHRGGITVIDSLQGRQTLALCTSSYVDPVSSLGSRVEILASPQAEGCDRTNKFESLGWKIHQFYAQKGEERK